MAELVPVLDQLASTDVPTLLGRRPALKALQGALAPAVAQAREAQRLLGDVPELRRISERMDAVVAAAEGGAHRDLRDVARELSVGLQRIDAELSPAARQADEIFERDAAEWSSDDIAALRQIFLEAPEHARPPVFGGPFRHKKETFELKDNLDYMITTRDSTDRAIANRFAATWRLERDPNVTRDSLVHRVDELFARDASTWTTREIHDLRAIFSAPERLRPQEVGGPYTVKNETFTIQSNLDWMTTTHDSTDIDVSNRFAAAWRAAGMDATSTAIASKVNDVFLRDSSTWTSAEISELRALLYDLPEHLRPMHGPERLGNTLNFRPIAGTKEEDGVRFSLREVVDFMATTHDAIDLQMSNMYAEAWLLASRDAKDQMLAQLLAHASTGEAVTGPGGRTPTEVTISILRNEFLADTAGTERALRAAALLSFANTRREVRGLLEEIHAALPKHRADQLDHINEQARVFASDNISRIDGHVPDGQVRGMRDHPRMDELGRLQSLVRLLRNVDHPPETRRVVTASPSGKDAIAW